MATNGGNLGFEQKLWQAADKLNGIWLLSVRSKKREKPDVEHRLKEMGL